MKRPLRFAVQVARDSAPKARDVRARSRGKVERYRRTVVQRDLIEK